MLGAGAGFLRRHRRELVILRQYAGDQVEQLVAGDEMLAELRKFRRFGIRKAERSFLPLFGFHA
jgi:hypothetical protein